MTDQAIVERELISRILNGERDLFHELIRPYERIVYLTAYAVLKNGAESEDVAQESIVKSYRALASFRGDSKFSTWLVSIVMNEARGHLRKVNRMNLESLDEMSLEGGDYTPAFLTDWREVPLEALENKELAAKIEEAIQDLPATYREVFILRDRDELSLDVIAGMLGISTGLVKVRLHRARMFLQKKLAPYLKNIASPRRRWPSFLRGKR